MPFGDIIDILSIYIFETLNMLKALLCLEMMSNINYSDETIINKL